MAIFFLCEPTTDSITLSEEHDDYKWIDAKEAKRLNIMAPEDKVLEKYFAHYA